MSSGSINPQVCGMPNLRCVRCNTLLMKKHSKNWTMATKPKSKTISQTSGKIAIRHPKPRLMNWWWNFTRASIHRLHAFDPPETGLEYRSGKIYIAMGTTDRSWRSQPRSHPQIHICAGFTSWKTKNWSTHFARWTGEKNMNWHILPNAICEEKWARKK